MGVVRTLGSREEQRAESLGRPGSQRAFRNMEPSDILAVASGLGYVGVWCLSATCFLLGGSSQALSLPLASPHPQHTHMPPGFEPSHLL